MDLILAEGTLNWMEEQKFPDKGFVGVKFRSSRGGSGHLVCLVSVWSGVHCGQRCQGGSVCLLYYKSDQIREMGRFDYGMAFGRQG